MSVIKYIYVCTSSTCGHTEQVTYAPSSTRTCPKCGRTMIRRSA